MARAKRVRMARSQAKDYLEKAQEFLDEAKIAQVARRWDAAMLNSIHAAISASDAATIALSGQRSVDPDHMRAADLLEEVGSASIGVKAQATQRRRLLALKNIVEYESRRSRQREVTDAVSELNASLRGRSR
jgi:hypothetical protein